MFNTRSGTGNDTAVTHETTIRKYLRTHSEVASKDELLAGTSVPAGYINQIAAEGSS